MVTCICSLGDRLAASGSDDHTVRLWDWRAKTCLHELVEHMGPVSGLCALGSEKLVTGSSDTTLCVWSAGTGKCLHSLVGHKGAIFNVHHLNGDQVVSSASDNTLCVWNAATGMLVNAIHMGTSFSSGAPNLLAPIFFCGRTYIAVGMNSGAVHCLELLDPMSSVQDSVICPPSRWAPVNKFLAALERQHVQDPATQSTQLLVGGGGSSNGVSNLVNSGLGQGNGGYVAATNSSPLLVAPSPTGARQDIHLAAGQVLYRSDIANPVTVYAGALRVYTFFVEADSKWVDYVVYSYELNAQEAADLGLTEKKFGWYHKELL
jgi:WD40 repeat protein